MMINDKMKTLTIEHLSAYLPYRLKWSLQELSRFTMSGIAGDTLYTEEGAVLNWQKHPDLPRAMFPLLRPLSQLSETIEHNGERFVPIDVLNGKFRNRSKDLVPYKYIDGNLELDITTDDYSQSIDLFDGYLIVQMLHSWHFDTFGLIESGLAIPIPSIPQP